MTSLPTAIPASRDGLQNAHASYRIAIVGGGPRALQVLDSLQQSWRKAHRPRHIAVTIFDPSPFPGAGAVYDPRQPPWLRMNYPSHRISAWSQTFVGDSSRPSFPEWARASGRLSMISDGFAPRALVGEYLAACFRHLLDHSPANVSCTVKRLNVERVVPKKLSACIRTSVGEEHFDEAVITTGHGATPLTHFDASRLVDKTIAIRGFALTAIDAIFSLTEGVGGSFDRSCDRWAYRRSGREPREIVPFSRTGQPLYAKPSQSVAERWAAFDGWDKHTRALTDLRSRHGDLDFVSDILPVLQKAADDFLIWSNPNPREAPISECRDYLLGATPLNAKHDPLEVWRSSYAVAIGRHTPNPPQAAAEAWRVLYPQLVRLVSHGGLVASSYEGWRRTAVAMERLAFGPPAESVGRLVALVEVGLLNLNFLQTPLIDPDRVRIRLRNGTYEMQADKLINAVIPSPATNTRSGIFSQLLSDGHISLSSEAFGVKVDRCGRPLDASPEGRRRLRVFGRATEGWIVGNDTLNRELHDEISAWSAQLVEKISLEI